MRILSGEEETNAATYFDAAIKTALSAKCHRSKCGSVIVKNNEIIGTGYNSPPLDRVSDRCKKDSLPPDFKSDKTCCVHAEQRAIMDALRRNPDNLIGSRIYFIRLDENGKMQKAGEPYCTICSKMALDAGIAEFVLWHEKGICVYDTDEYNTLSFRFRKSSQETNKN